MSRFIWDCHQADLIQIESILFNYQVDLIIFEKDPLFCLNEINLMIVPNKMGHKTQCCGLK